MGALVEGPAPAKVERLQLASASGGVPVFHARPDDHSGLGVVVHPDILGIRPLFDDLCRRLATYGLAVCAPEPFARIDEHERSGLDAAARMERVKDLDDDEQLGDLAAAGELLRRDDGVERVAMLGFCMGGMYTLKASGSGHFDRAVAFYGMLRLPEAWRGPGQGEPLAAVTGACPTLAIFGGADPWTPIADIEALRAEWRDHPEHEIVVYDDADHGFVHDPERPAHRADDAADAWRRALTFLGVR